METSALLKSAKALVHFIETATPPIVDERRFKIINEANLAIYEAEGHVKTEIEISHLPRQLQGC